MGKLSGSSRRFPTGFHNAGQSMVINDGNALLVGHPSKVAAFGTQSAFQVLGTGAADGSMVLARFQNNANGPFITMLKSRAASIGDSGAVQNGDDAGVIHFVVDDGNDFISKIADIFAEVDGTPGVDDTPGALVLQTTDTGSASPTVKLRLDKVGARFPTLPVADPAVTGYLWVDTADAFTVKMSS